MAGAEMIDAAPQAVADCMNFRRDKLDRIDCDGVLTMAGIQCLECGSEQQYISSSALIELARLQTARRANLESELAYAEPPAFLMVCVSIGEEVGR